MKRLASLRGAFRVLVDRTVPNLFVSSYVQSFVDCCVVGHPEMFLFASRCIEVMSCHSAFDSIGTDLSVSFFIFFSFASGQSFLF